MIILINWKEIALSNILNLDKILCIFFGENIFTNLNNNEYNKTVDVRSAEEFNAIKLLHL